MTRLSDQPFVPALPGGWVRAGKKALDTTNEEAAHAVVAVVLGLDLRECRIDRPDIDVAGRVVVRPREGTYFEHLLCVLAGPIAVGRWEVLEWPLDETDDGDVGIVARLCKHLELSRVDLFMAEGRVRRQLEEPFVKRALREVGWELLERGAITGDEVRRIVTREAEAEVGKASTVRRAKVKGCAPLTSCRRAPLRWSVHN